MSDMSGNQKELRRMLESILDIYFPECVGFEDTMDEMVSRGECPLDSINREVCMHPTAFKFLVENKYMSADVNGVEPYVPAVPAGGIVDRLSGSRFSAK